jgi:hypothetical protein
MKCCITYIGLCQFNHSCILYMKTTWSCWMIFLMCCWIWLANVCVLFIFIHKGNLSTIILCHLVSEQYWLCIMTLKVFLPFLFCWNTLRTLVLSLVERTSRIQNWICPIWGFLLLLLEDSITPSLSVLIFYLFRVFIYS